MFEEDSVLSLTVRLQTNQGGTAAAWQSNQSKQRGKEVGKQIHLKSQFTKRSDCRIPF